MKKKGIGPMRTKEVLLRLIQSCGKPDMNPDSARKLLGPIFEEIQKGRPDLTPDDKAELLKAHDEAIEGAAMHLRQKCRKFA